jgi:hypothetical protein
VLKNQLLTFILRGALGGAIGFLLFVSYLSYKRPFNGLAIPYAPLIGAVIGAIIGIIIWTCFLVAKRNIGIIMRSLIGVGLVSMLLIVISLKDRDIKIVRLSDQDEIAARYSKDEFITEIIVMVLLNGALPAAIARPKG